MRAHSSKAQVCLALAEKVEGDAVAYSTAWQKHWDNARADPLPQSCPFAAGLRGLVRWRPRWSRR